MSRKSPKGFTLIELLVVVAIIALLLSIVIPSLQKAKLYAQRVVCSNQIRQLSIGSLLYAEQFDNSLPLNSVNTWLWDISYLATDFLMHNTGMVRETFYCPADYGKLPDDDRMWRFSESNPNVPGTPEPTTQAARRSNFRVTSYFYLMDTQNGRSYVARRNMVSTAPQRPWPRKTTDIRNAGTWELITDAAISTGSGNPQTDSFVDIRAGSYDKWGVFDNTNHVDRRKRPLGANIGFADGHVDWRGFDQMAVWGPWGPYHWW